VAQTIYLGNCLTADTKSSVRSEIARRITLAYSKINDLSKLLSCHDLPAATKGVMSSAAVIGTLMYGLETAVFANQEWQKLSGVITRLMQRCVEQFDANGNYIHRSIVELKAMTKINSSAKTLSKRILTYYGHMKRAEEIIIADKNNFWYSMMIPLQASSRQYEDYVAKILGSNTPLMEKKWRNREVWKNLVDSALPN
jgi:galactokinase/mevalonate kinase-like predicted kinase